MNSLGRKKKSILSVFKLPLLCPPKFKRAAPSVGFPSCLFVCLLRVYVGRWIPGSHQGSFVTASSQGREEAEEHHHPPSKSQKVCAPCPSFKNKIHKTSVFSGSLFVQVVCSATQKCLQERLNCS